MPGCRAAWPPAVGPDTAGTALAGGGEVGVGVWPRGIAVATGVCVECVGA